MAEKAAEADGADGASAPTKKKMSGKKLVLFIVLPLLLLGGGGAAAYFLLFKEEPKKEEAHGTEGGDHAAEGEGEGEPEEDEEEGHLPAFVELAQIKANLIMTGKKQPFMVTTMVLEVSSPEDQKVVEEVKPRIESEINIYLRSLRPEDVQGAAGLQRLREELLLRVKAAAKPAKVKDILFKEMLVQQ